MAAAKPRLHLLRKTLIYLSPRSFSFSASASAVVPLDQLRQAEEAEILDDAHYLSLVPADLLQTKSISREKPLYVLKFLKSCGLDDARITQFVAKRPKVLFADVDKGLAPKFQLLQNLGMSAAEVAGIFEKTNLLGHNVSSHLGPRIDFFRSILHSDEDVARVFKKTGWSLEASHKLCNRMTSIISILKDLGFTDDFIKKLILQNPQHFQLKPELIRQAIGRVKPELGVEYESNYVHFYVIVTLCQLDTLAIASKFNIFKNFGWSMADILAMVGYKPDCLLVNDKKLNMGLDFLIKTAGFSPSYVAKRPVLLMMNIESRIIPRFNAFSALKKKNLIRQKVSFYYAASMTEALFLEKYILRFEQEAPDVCKAYLNSKELCKKK